jgi:hypothetical protein
VVSERSVSKTAKFLILCMLPLNRRRCSCIITNFWQPSKYQNFPETTPPLRLVSGQFPENDHLGSISYTKIETVQSIGQKGIIPVGTDTSKCNRRPKENVQYRGEPECWLTPPSTFCVC